MHQTSLGADFRGDWIGIAEQQSLVATAVANDFYARVDLGVAFDESANGGTEAGG